MNYKTSIVWLRRDIRLEDNRALFEACCHSETVIPVFVFDTNILDKLKNKNDRRVYFIYQTLLELNQFLLSHGKSLLIIYGNPIEELPKLAKNYNAQCVFTNKDYEPKTIERDQKVSKVLSEIGIHFKLFKDQVIFEENEILKTNKTPYVVFTPYKNEWLKCFSHITLKTYSYQISKFINKDKIKNINFHWNINCIHFNSTNLLINPGRTYALHLLEKFANKINNYDSSRDYFAANGTSMLSMHLRFGTLSIREAFIFANKYPSKGADIWKSELIWREFYKMILSQFPHVEKKCFKSEYEHLKWENNADYFECWKSGLTGFPVVDAAMRCFQQTGWMHNRLRMIVASFLTKDLLVDYRKGESYFAEHLLDFDMSANNGGWQWSASTGCDAQPFFRVFNPEAQSLKFDPTGQFIKTYCPELSHCDAKQIHAPHKYFTGLFSANLNYPKPIVQHDKQRMKAMQMFKK